MSRPLVSVILPVHNREHSIARAIRSVLAQTYEPLELIVVDDGSTDGTRRVVETFLHPNLRLLTLPHGGVYVARNRALREASGELIAFIDSDDQWLPHRLESQLPLLQNPEVGLVFGDATHVTPEGERIGSLSCFRVSPPASGDVLKALVGRNFVPTITVLVRRQCMEEVGGFPEDLPSSADYVAWFRVALRYKFDYVERSVADYTVDRTSLSGDLGRALAARIELFSRELNRTEDRATRALIRQLLFNLSCHLILAALRGRARNRRGALRLASSTALTQAGLAALPWALLFLWTLVYNRARRLVP